MIGAPRSACVRVVWHQVGTNTVSVLKSTHITQKAKIAGRRTLYFHDEEHPAEICAIQRSRLLIRIDRSCDVVARLMSPALQSGAPLETVGDLLVGAQFAPCALSPGTITSSSVRVARFDRPASWWRIAAITNWLMRHYRRTQRR